MSDSLDALPSPLIDAIREGRALLFLGAGASYEALHPKGKSIPDGLKLRDLISDRFLEGEMKSASLQECSDYAIDSHDLNSFQRFIRDTFFDFRPADFHKLIPTFNWTGIFTTNYDLIVERAYEGIFPEPVVYLKDGQKVDLELRQRPNSILLTKLHGSIDHYTDNDIPLVLSSDQYVAVSKHRRMLFDRLLTLAGQFPVIFVGYRATDLHIKRIFSELDQLGQRRPRYFYVGPNIKSFQRNYLESRRTTCIDATFKDFMVALDRQLSSKLRTIKVEIGETLSPLRKHINVPKPSPSGDLLAFLTNDCDYIHSTMPVGDGKKVDFYEGVPLGFYPITNSLDVRRNKKTDTLLSDIFFRLDDDSGERNSAELVVVKGAAGSGKSVFLRRLAWEAAIDFDCLCLVHRRTGALRFSAIHELYGMTGTRIFLFVDRAAYHVDEIEDLLTRSKSVKIPLTIITAERHNEWNARCEQLDRFVVSEEELTNLSGSEVSELVGKLRDANALGQLSEKSDAECKEIFEEKLNRQILVALHEATKGKSFEEIVVDEYKRIIPIEAQLLYLDICTIQRLGADLRAGLLSRIGGVSFDEFKERLLHPLEKVVFVSSDKYGQDHLYRARHQRIAEIVFDKVLASQKEKYDALLRLLKGMNRDFAPDNDAFETLMHGSTLRNIFTNGDLARELLDEGLSLSGDEGFILHQRAVFELQHSDGDLNVALDSINKALAKSPEDKAKLNTKANVYRRMALDSRNDIKRAHLRSEAIDVLNSIGSKGVRDSTLSINIQIDELNDLLKSAGEGALTDRAISTKIHDIERALTNAHARSEADPYVLQVEARYRQELNQDNRALAALKRANTLNPGLVPIALRLARVYVDGGKHQQAITVLNDALTRNPTKELRFELGKILSDRPELQLRTPAAILFENSFDIDDDLIVPRLYLMREFWRGRKMDKFKQLQQRTKRMSASRQLRQNPNFILESADGEPLRFSGSIRAKEADYAFISPDDGYPDVFFHRTNCGDIDFDGLGVGSKFSFKVGFCTNGATALTEK